MKNTIKTMMTCVESGIWPQSLIPSDYLTEDSFQEHLATQEKYGHTDLYRLNWYKNCNLQALSKWMDENTDKWREVVADGK